MRRLTERVKARLAGALYGFRDCYDPEDEADAWQRRRTRHEVEKARLQQSLMESVQQRFADQARLHEEREQHRQTQARLERVLALGTTALAADEVAKVLHDSHATTVQVMHQANQQALEQVHVLSGLVRRLASGQVPTVTVVDLSDLGDLELEPESEIDEEAVAS